MGWIVWPLAFAATFAIGWAVGSHARPEPEQETVSLLRQQVAALQARLRARDESPGARTPARAPRAAASWTGAAAWPPPATFEPELGAREPQSVPRAAGPRPGPSATVGAVGTREAALERFRQYLAAAQGEGREQWRLARELVQELRDMGDVAVHALMQVLAGGGDSDERRAAARLLGSLQAPQALPLLQEVLERDPDVLLRRAAAAGLRQLQTPDAVPVMNRILANPGEDRFVRLSAAYGLAEAGQPEGVRGLARIFAESTLDGRGRDMAFRAMAALSDERPLPFMRELVNSEAELSYRLRAIQYVATHRDKQALAALRVVMHSPDEQPSIRDAAAQAYATLVTR